MNEKSNVVNTHFTIQSPRKSQFWVFAFFSALFRETMHIVCVNSASLKNNYVQRIIEIRQTLSEMHQVKVMECPTILEKSNHLKTPEMKENSLDHLRMTRYWSCRLHACDYFQLHACIIHFGFIIFVCIKIAIRTRSLVVCFCTIHSSTETWKF